MKRIITLILVVCCLILTGCNNTSVGIIGGADGPTEIYVKGQFGKQYEKKPIRMFNLDGDLYYDSGLVSDITPRCGTLDGNLKRSVNANEIPHKSGESNFDIDGYQHGTGITKEVNIDGEWVIFKKYENQPKKLEKYIYCFYIKGHLNNASVDSEIVVLSENIDVTFNDVYEPLLSSVKQNGDDKCLISYNTIVSGDKWGLSLSVLDITNKGVTIKFEQFGGNPTGELQTGSWYKLETSVNDVWQPVETKSDNSVWNSLAYGIKKNDITELEVNWEFLYGELPCGFYRLSKEIMDFRSAGDYDKELYQVTFTIE